MTTHELIKMYRLPGADEAAGELLRQRGDSARDEIIALLDDGSIPPEECGPILQILNQYFPSQQSADAIQRYTARLPDPKMQQRVSAVQEAMKDAMEQARAEIAREWDQLPEHIRRHMKKPEA